MNYNLTLYNMKKFTFYPRFREGMLFTILLLTFHVSLVKANWVQVNNGLPIWDVNALCSYTSGGVNYVFAGTLYGGGNSGVVFVTTNDGNSWTRSANWPNDVWSLATTSNGNVHYVFAGTGNGMGYTTNNGANWYAVGGPSPPGWTVSLAVSGNYVFAGTYNYADTGGVYKSTNYGVNWIRVTYFPPVPSGYKYYVGMNGNYVYASSSYAVGIDVSTDYGITWALSSPSIYMNSFAYNTNYLFVGGGSGLSAPVYKSSNNGFNWIPTSLDSVAIMALAVYNNVVFAGASGNGYGLFLSTDNGLTWIQRSEGGVGLITSLCISNNYIFAGSSGGGVYRRP